MRTVFRIFFKSDGASPWLTLLCLLSASLFGGIGIATLLPLLTIATDSESSSPLVRFSQDLFDRIGLPLAIEPLLVIITVGLALKAALTLAANYYMGYATTEVTARLRRKLIPLSLAARWGWFVQQPSGRLHHALFGLTSSSGTAYGSAARFIAQMLETAAYAVVALIVSWKVALAGALAGLVIAALLDRFVRRTRKAGKKETVRKLELSIIWSNTLGNLKALKAMSRHHDLSRLFDHKILQWRKIARKQVFNREGRTGFQDIIFACLLGMGAYLALIVWQVPVVELIVIAVVLNRGVRGVGKLQSTFQSVVAHEYPFRELQQLMKEVAAAREPYQGGKLATLTHSCRFEGVDFAYSDKPVLTSVNLELSIGKITVLTGPSGAGKTTIADLLLGLLSPDRGRITVDGVPLSELDVESLRRLTGYVPQESVLLHESVLTNIQLGDPTISVKDVEEALHLAGAWEFVSERPRGMNTIVGERGQSFSGGQRQRLALARALVHQPRLLILDEVTSALDPETERSTCELVRDLSKEIAVLAITHRPAFLEIADEAYELVDGRLQQLQPLLAAGD